ncbi:MAG: type I-U CRISPR-associated protein Csb2 [Dehalococcoidia bacterium]
MIAIGVRYLMGWSMATDSADRERPEWPPHPDRVFMALAAAHFETDGPDSERQALVWLEGQGPPEMRATESTERNTMTTFVPVNDPGLSRLRKDRAPSLQQIKAGLQLLPEHRTRQPRQFPVAIPHDPTVYLVWPADPSQEVRKGLGALCGKVVRIGHSASLVQAWVEDAPPTPNLVPVEGLAHHPLRVAGPGRLDHLTGQYLSDRRPERSRWAAYGQARPQSQPAEPHSVFHDALLVLRRVSGNTLGLESTLILTEKLRDAVVKQCPQPVPEWISGHEPDRRPSRHPHLAFLPLPDIGHQHADGHLLGFALAVPNHLERAEVGRCLNPVLGFTQNGSLRRVHLYDGGYFDWWLELERRESPPVALRSSAWTRWARRWATVTPVVFDRHPKGRSKEGQAEVMVQEACERVGLPRPLEVVLSQVTLHLGAPHSRAFPYLRRKSDSGRLQHLHAVVTFAEPVHGPVILGAGRYRGYGLFRPVEWEGGDQE